MVFYYFAKYLYRVLNRLGYIIVIVLLFLQTGGVVLYHRAQQYLHHISVQRSLFGRSTNLIHFTLTTGEYHQDLVDDDELLINGKMHDVRSVSINGDVVNISAIQDNEEDRIIERLKKFLTHSNNEELPDTIVHLLTLDYILPQPALFYCSNVLISKTFITRSIPVCSRETDITLPPPRI